VQAIHHHHHTVFEILCGIVLYIRFRSIHTLLCYTLVSASVLGIGIASGQYYWILGAFLGIVLTIHGSNLYTSVCVFIASTLYLHCATRKAGLRELDKAAELAIIGHSVGAFVSTLDAPHLKYFATNVVRDVTSWLVKLFR